MSTTSAYSLNVGVTTAVQLEKNTRWIIAVNKSPYDVIYSDYGILGRDWIPSGTAVKLDGDVLNSGRISLTLINNANISPQNPGIVLLTQYDVSEPGPQGTYPISIPAQTVTVGASVTDHIVNDGNAAGTQIIEAKVAGDTVSTVTLTNDAQFILGDAAHSGYIKTQQIDTDGLQVFGSGIALYGGKTFGNGGWVWSDFSSDLDYFITAKRNIILNSRVSFISGTITRISNFTGAATGTYNHNLGATPDLVLPMTSQSGSQTMGYDSANSTQVHITSFSGLNFKALAIAF